MGFGHHIILPIIVVLVIGIVGVRVLENSHAATTVAMSGKVALGLSTSATPFTSSSFWNVPLPANTPVNVNNAAYQNVIEDNFCNIQTAVPSTKKTCPTSTFSGGLNVSQFSAPLYVVPAGQAKVAVTLSCPGAPGHTPSAALKAAVAGGVPVPTNAHAAAGTDQEIQIYQPSSNKYWEFWRFENTGTNKWIACWGGQIANVSGSTGNFPNDLGATATSIPLLGGIVQISQMQSGQINHVIGLTIGDASSGDLSTSVKPANVAGATSGVSFPATHGDGGSKNPLAVPPGTRFRLPASLNLNNLNLTPVGKEIAVAAQKYGLVVYDSSPQASLNFRLGDPIGYTTAGLANPYTSGPGVGGVGTKGLFAGVTQGAVLKNFPWQQLQALPYNYNK